MSSAPNISQITTILRDAVPRQTFQRGEDVAANGDVRALKRASGDDPNVVRLRGQVAAGRTTSLYTAALTVDLAAGRVTSHSCTCTARSTNGEPCKHSVALGIAYVDEQGGSKQRAKAPAGAAGGAATSGDAMSSLKLQTQELLERYRAAAAAAAPAQDEAEPATSPQAARLMRALSQDRAVVDEAEPGQQPVRLVPTLAPAGRGGAIPGMPDDRCWELKLRVERGEAAYVVKAVDALVRAWEDRAEASYGRNLAFVHVPAAFDERSRALLELMTRILNSQNAQHICSRTGAGYAAARPTASAKSLYLSERDAADVLDLFCGSTVAFELREAGAVKAQPLEVREGDPQAALEVTRGRRGGYDVDLSFCRERIMDGDRMYLVADGAVWRCSESYRAQLGTLCRTSLPLAQPIHVSSADMPDFCATVLPAVRSCGAVRLPADFEVELPPEPEASFSMDLVDDFVTCDAVVRYGTGSVGLFDRAEPRGPVRDALRERRWRALVEQWFPQQALPVSDAVDPEGARTPHWRAGTPLTRRYLDAHNAEALHGLLSTGLRSFKEQGSVFVSENLGGVRVRKAPKARLEVRSHGKLLELAVSSDDLSPADLAAYLASYARRERFVRLTNGDVMRIEEKGVGNLAELADMLGIAVEDFVRGTHKVPSNRALFVDALASEVPDLAFERDEAFRSIVAQFDEIATAPIPAPQGLAAELRHYQVEGFRWLTTLARLGFGGILADDMGLGKTLQLIAFLQGRREDGVEAPALVVCPSSLVYNWMSELARFAPGLAARAVVGPKEERTAIVADRGAAVFVTSYELMKRDVDLYADRVFSCMVLDEAQYIKNHTTQTARTTKRIAADVRFALTGTPVENRLAELWSLFDFLMPGILGSYPAFRERYEAPISEVADDEAAQRLQRMVAPFILRRMKDDVLGDLPSKTETVVVAPLEGEQRKLYTATSDQLALSLAKRLPQEFARDRVQVLAELTRLRQICCDPRLVFEGYEGPSAKLEACVELVRNAVDGGHKVLVFSQFTSMLALIAERLDQEGVARHVLTGSTSKEDRARLVDAFQTDDVPAFLISLKAGGVGLNLTAADIVVHFDPWWNLAAQNQATDRAHRIGQTRPVTVFQLIAKDTIEERIVALQEAKRDLAESVLGGEAAGSASLTRDDVLALLGWEG